MDNSDKLLDILNTVISLVEPITYKDFNRNLKCLNDETKIKLRELETKHNELGLVGYDTKDEGISTLSLIATITDILCSKRLAFKINNETNIIEGFCWYTK